MSKITASFRPPNRREILGLALGSLAPLRAEAVESHQATGVKVGEVSDRSAVLWGRRTQYSTRRADGIVRKGARGAVLPLGFDISSLQG
ncbi:MAG: hypothetical protein JJE04_17590, partial [Acidobacteriia bacterium]|nr:hypothetical protein [Terriglobia bacterium]